MTNEEAINLLDLQLHGTPEQIEQYGSYEHATAIRMAISALKTKSCEDCISRQAILKLPKKTMKNYFGEVVGDVVFIEDIKALPPVVPKQEWTHVSEGSPKESDEYLVSVIDEYDENYEAVGVARYDIKEGEWQGLGVDRTVIAWMPKPATYKEGERE